MRETQRPTARCRGGAAPSAARGFRRGVWTRRRRGRSSRRARGLDRARIAVANGLDQTAPAVCVAATALAAGALDAVVGGGAVAHHAAERAALEDLRDVLGVSARRIQKARVAVIALDEPERAALDAQSDGGVLVPLDDGDREVADKARNEADPRARHARNREEAKSNRNAEIDAAVLACVTTRPGIGATDLRVRVKAKAGCGPDAAD